MFAKMIARHYRLFHHVMFIKPKLFVGYDSMASFIIKGCAVFLVDVSAYNFLFMDIENGIPKKLEDRYQWLF